MQGLVAYSSSDASSQETADTCSSSSSNSSDSEAEHGHTSKRVRLSCRSQQPAASVVAAAPAASDLSAWEAPGLQAGEAKLCSDAQAARLYKGKQLAFPIVHGQYATLVMIPVKLDNEQLTALHALINSLQQLMPGLTSLLPTVENHHPASTPAATTGQAPPVHAPIATSGPSQSHAPNTTARELAPTANGPSQHVPYMEPAAAASAASQKEPALPPRNIAAPSRAPTTAVGSKAVPPAPQPALELPLPHISLSRTVPMAFSKVELLVGGLRDALARTQSVKLALGVRALRAPLARAHPPQPSSSHTELTAQGGQGSHTAAAAQCTDCCRDQGQGQALEAPSDAVLLASEARMEGLAVLTNDERTRTFLCVELQQGVPQVTSLIRSVDRVFSLHGLQTFYQDPQPHLSIAWVLGDQRSALERALSQLASQLLRSPLLPSQHGHAAVQNLRPLHPLQAEPATDGNQNQGQGGKYGDGDGKSEEACGDLKVFRCELCVHEILCRVGIKEHVVWQQER